MFPDENLTLPDMVLRTAELKSDGTLKTLGEEVLGTNLRGRIDRPIVDANDPIYTARIANIARRRELMNRWLTPAGSGLAAALLALSFFHSGEIQIGASLLFGASGGYSIGDKFLKNIFQMQISIWRDRTTSNLKTFLGLRELPVGQQVVEFNGPRRRNFGRRFRVFGLELNDQHNITH